MAKNKKYEKRNSNSQSGKKPYQKDSKESKYNPKNSTETKSSGSVYNVDLASSAARESFNIPLGTKYSLYPQSGNDYFLPIVDQKVPGICSIELLHTIGASDPDEVGSAITIAAMKGYTYILHSNSRSGSYEAPDVMMYYLAMDSVYSLFYYLVRAYGILSTFSADNRYYPLEVFKHMKLDYDSFSTNMPDFRAMINLMAYRLSSLRVPKNFNYTARHVGLYSNIYLDEPHSKAQSYLFVPAGFHRLIEGDENHPVTYLAFQAFPGSYGTPASFAQIRTYVEQFTNSLLGSSDIMRMGGDILKAYGPENLQLLPYVDEMYNIVPVYNDVVLSQIQNAVLNGERRDVYYGDGGSELSWDIYQNPGVNKGTIYQNLAFWAYGSGADHRRLLTLKSDAPTASEILDATRLTTISRYADDLSISSIANTPALAHTPVSCGTEVATQMVVSQVTDYSGAHKPKYYTSFETINFAANDANYLTTRQFAKACALSKFKQHPAIHFSLVTMGHDAEYEYLGSLSDVDNYITLDENELNIKHETALMAYFNAPNY